ncbi:hypothetical protein N7492_000665 [Penicillium capsulatum]|uniref:Transmembrane protein n=1 Tax=Penicillium capsulatum TaxID=69766 RepID=A0A9W9IS69_9EURO|nr:hypothetical protein N7492_000665 [Penicillium capsulatum]KAJ6130276.1 hypothetical protein N7512_003056 [Penicillium capsulatum]
MFALPWLLFVALVPAAAIPLSSYPQHNDDPKEAIGVRAFVIPSQSQSTQPSQLGDSSPVAKREPYYFPESMPSIAEDEERFISLREAGFVKGSYSNTVKKPNPKSTTPDAVIDIPPAFLMLPDRESRPDSTSKDSTTALIWENSPNFFPPLGFFVGAAVLACLATIIRGTRHSERHAITSNVGHQSFAKG